MMIKKIAHVCIQCPNLLEAKKFYHEHLELPIAFEFRKGDDLVGFYFKAGDNTYIEVFKGLAEKEGPVRHFCLEADNLEILRRSLVGKGIAATEIKMGNDQSYQFWIDAPGNLRIEFHQYTAESYQVNGGICQVNW